jgi:hypothetical protein
VKPFVFDTTEAKDAQKRARKAQAQKDTGLGHQEWFEALLKGGDRPAGPPRQHGPEQAPKSQLPAPLAKAAGKRPAVPPERRDRVRNTPEFVYRQALRSGRYTEDELDLLNSALYMRATVRADIAPLMPGGDVFGGRAPKGRRARSPVEAADVPGYLTNGQVLEALRQVRSPEGRAAIEVERDAFRRRRAEMSTLHRSRLPERGAAAPASGLVDPYSVAWARAPFAPESLEHARRLGLTAVQGRRGEVIELSDALAIAERIEGRPVSPVRQETDEQQAERLLNEGVGPDQYVPLGAGGVSATTAPVPGPRKSPLQNLVEGGSKAVSGALGAIGGFVDRLPGGGKVQPEGPVGQFATGVEKRISDAVATPFARNVMRGMPGGVSGVAVLSDVFDLAGRPDLSRGLADLVGGSSSGPVRTAAHVEFLSNPKQPVKDRALAALQIGLDVLDWVPAGAVGRAAKFKERLVARVRDRAGSEFADAVRALPEDAIEQAADEVVGEMDGRFSSLVRDRDSFKAAMASQLGLSDDQAEAVATVQDAFARNWAQRAQADPADWYSVALRGVGPDDGSAALAAAAVGADSPRGALQRMADGGAVLRALESPDVTTALHEMAHVWERYVDPEVWDLVKSGFAARRRGAPNASEWFAEELERYAHRGVTPNAKLRPAMQQFAQWFDEVYSAVSGRYATPTPEGQAVFDRLLDAADDLAPATPAAAPSKAVATTAVDAGPATSARANAEGASEPFDREGFLAAIRAAESEAEAPEPGIEFTPAAKGKGKVPGWSRADTEEGAERLRQAIEDNANGEGQRLTEIQIGTSKWSLLPTAQNYYDLTGRNPVVRIDGEGPIELGHKRSGERWSKATGVEAMAGAGYIRRLGPKRAAEAMAARGLPGLAVRGETVQAPPVRRFGEGPEFKKGQKAALKAPNGESIDVELRSPMDGPEWGGKGEFWEGRLPEPDNYGRVTRVVVHRPTGRVVFGETSRKRDWADNFLFKLEKDGRQGFEERVAALDDPSAAPAVEPEPLKVEVQSSTVEPVSPGPRVQPGERKAESQSRKAESQSPETLLPGARRVNKANLADRVEEAKARVESGEAKKFGTEARQSGSPRPPAELAPDTRRAREAKAAARAKRDAAQAKRAPSAFDGLPQRARDVFDSAVESADLSKLKEIVHPSNKVWRAEFERRTGTKLPRTVAETEAAVAEWAKRADEAKAGVAPEKAASPVDESNHEFLKPAVALKMADQARGGDPGALVTTRIGDFFEFFGDDAERAAKALQITLTGREVDGKRVPMSGVPFHSAHRYFEKLREAGINVVRLMDSSGATAQWTKNGFVVKRKDGALPAKTDAALTANEAEFRRAFMEQGGEDVKFQGGRDDRPRMMAVHSLTEDKLAFADKMGGFASPSIGVVTETKGGVDGFGGITLIGTRGLGDPATSRVFSGDAWSPRHPKADWPKVTLKDLQAMSKRIEPYVKEFDDDSLRWDTWRYMGEDHDLDTLIERWERSPAAVAMYLRSKGVPFEAAPAVPGESNNYMANSLRARKAVEGEQGEFRKWIQDTLRPYFGQPTMKLGGRKVPYTLDNIVKAMTARGVRNREKGLVFGSGAAKAAMTKQFRSLDEMRKASGGIVDPDELAAMVSDDPLRDFRLAVVDHYQGGTFDGFDAAMRAAAAAGKRATVSQEALRSALAREGFKVAEIPTETLTAGVEAIERFKAVPVPYFESKPQRAVRISEFAGAVVPSDASPAAREILDRHGVPYREYPADDKAARRRLTKEFAAELGGDRETLFQGAADEPTWKLKSVDALRRLKGALPGEQVRATLLNAGVTEDELRWAGVDDWIAGAENGRVKVEELRAHIEREAALRFIEDRKMAPDEDAVIERAQELRDDAIRDRVDDIMDKNPDYDEEEVYEMVSDQVDSDYFMDDAREELTGTSDAASFREHTLRGEPETESEYKGSVNYREFLLRYVPESSAPQFTGGHWGERNVIVHARASDLWAPPQKGGVLLVEELQSDWHQTARDVGYRTDADDGAIAEGRALVQQYSDDALASQKALDAAVAKLHRSRVAGRRAIMDELESKRSKFAQERRVGGDVAAVGREILELEKRSRDYEEETQRLRWLLPEQSANKRATDQLFDARAELSKIERRPPAGPLARVWHETAFRRMVQVGAREGYDAVAWTGGNVHADRYDRLLASNIDKVVVRPAERQLVVVDAYQGELLRVNEVVGREQLSDYLGRQMAEKALVELEAGRTFEATGKDLTIGGQGFAEFYDGVVRRYAEKFARKFGGTVKKGLFEIVPEKGVDYLGRGEGWFVGDPLSGELRKAGSQAEAQKIADEINARAHELGWRIEITDAMRRSVDEGVYLFQPKTAPAGLEGATRVEPAKRPTERRAAVIRAAEDVGVPFGNVFDKLRSLGEPGTEARAAGERIAAELENVLQLSSAHTLRIQDVLIKAVQAEFGRLAGVRPDARRELAKVARALHEGTADNLPERLKRVHAVWTEINKALVDTAEELGLMVDDVVRPRMPETLEGTVVHWYGQASDGTWQSASGLVLQSDKHAFRVKQFGAKRNVTLDVGTPISRRHLVAAEDFFPRMVKDEVYDAIERGRGKVYEAVLDSVVAANLADDRESAAAVLQKLVNGWAARVGDETIGRLARIDRPRLPFKLPVELYEDDFMAVSMAHISAVVQRITEARWWGQDSSRFHRMLGTAAVDKAERATVARQVQYALGHGRVRSRRDVLVRRLLDVENSWQLLTKMTGLGTTLVQLSAAANAYGVLGAKAGLQAAKALAEDFPELVRLRRGGMLEEVRLSGAVSSDIAEMMAVNDVSAMSRALNDAGLTVVGVKPVDVTLRYYAAVMGLYAAKDAARRLKVVGGTVKRDANYRLLSEWFRLTDPQIVRAAQKGFVDDDLRVAAFHGGARTQLRSRTADMPPLMAQFPILRVFTRFQTFNYQQARLLGWAIKEAGKGNPKILARLVAGYAAAGFVTVEAADQLLSWIEDRAPKDVSENVTFRIAQNMVKGGLLGMWGRGFSDGRALNDDDGRDTAGKTFLEFVRSLGRVEAPLVRDLEGVGKAWRYAEKTDGGAAAFADELARETVVLYRRFSRRSEPDYRHVAAMRKKERARLAEAGWSDSAIGEYLEALHQTPAPRGATQQYRDYLDARRGLVRRGLSVDAAGDRLGRAPAKFAGERDQASSSAAVRGRGRERIRPMIRRDVMRQSGQ